MPSALKYINKLQDQRVLILGGSSGIGFCVAEAALEHGATIILSSSNQTKLDVAVARLEEHAQATGLSADNGILAKTCDLSNQETIEGNIIQLLEFATRDGKLDHVVFTAGDSLRFKGLKDMTVADIHATNMVRQIGGIMLAKHLTPYMNNCVRSSLTLTGGINTWRPSPNWAVIASNGGATEALARGFAVDLRPIRVNCVEPGAIYTELWGDIPEERLPQVIESYKKATITGTIGKPEDVAEAYIYCMKDAFTTAGVIESNGGGRAGDSRDPLTF
ncbi:Short-chain dehydrogenase/reductase phqE [Cladobotryum mycophilum]|uniref:Short-chain dehydrogenase/reductase phqE n=1 Tax=Cladobotryum mycophilum TaxID=491253 RepID=A0ABR0SVB3_9HYPO